MGQTRHMKHTLATWDGRDQIVGDHAPLSRVNSKKRRIHADACTTDPSSGERRERFPRWAVHWQRRNQEAWVSVCPSTWPATQLTKIPVQGSRPSSIGVG